MSEGGAGVVDEAGAKTVMMSEEGRRSEEAVSEGGTGEVAGW